MAAVPLVDVTLVPLKIEPDPNGFIELYIRIVDEAFIRHIPVTILVEEPESTLAF